VACDTIPLLVFKAKSAEEAKEKFLKNVVPKYLEEIQRGIKIRPLTLEELDELIGDQFSISPETGC